MTDLVIVTGASRGLGLALTRNIPFPARVVDISRSGPPANEGVAHVAADLSRPEQWERVGAEMRGLVTDLKPTRAVFVHSAGAITPIGFAGEVDSAAYTANVILNSASGQSLGHHFLQAVSGRQGTFDLVMITSGAARNVYPGWSSYGAGKAALNQWVRNVAAEQTERGHVRVSAIAPGVMSTAMQAEIRSTSDRDLPGVERFRSLHVAGGLVDPEDAARRLWALLETGVETGSVLDLRDIDF